MNVTCSDLKKVSLEFRTYASRLLRTDFREGMDNLRRFLSLIDSTPILREFIEKCRKDNSCAFDIETIVSSRKYGELYQVPTTREGEVSFVYALLSQGIKRFTEYWQLCSGYSFGTELQDHVDAFNRMVVMPFVNHLLLRLEEEAITLGCTDDKSRIHVDGNVGQLNLAEGHGTITATSSYVEAGSKEIAELAERFVGLALQSGVSRDECEELRDLLESVVEQVRDQRPKKGVLKAAIDKVRAVTSLAKDVGQLTMVAMALAEKLQDVLSRL